MVLTCSDYRISDRQHDALKLLLGGNHVKKIRSPRTVLDLGAGKGAWAVEIAQEFATADEVVGVDIESIAPQSYPLNCRFEVSPLSLSIVANLRLRIFILEFVTQKTTFPSCTLAVCHLPFTTGRVTYRKSIESPQLAAIFNFAKLESHLFLETALFDTTRVSKYWSAHYKNTLQ